ncbi:MAG: Fic family protein [bacterium]|nr:Fic family protein [bacterium]
MQDEIKLTKNSLKELLKNKNNRAILYKWLKSELAYTSNAIEGNTLTKKETELVIEENLTSSSKPFVYYQEAVNHARAFERIIEIVKENLSIDEKEILNIHKIILNGIDNTNAGFYRDCMVRISGSRTVLPNPIKVPALMTDFCKWLVEQDLSNPDTAILAHLKFVSIHPFVDGNGRCARLLMNLLLLKAGYAPIIIRKTDRKRYLDVIEKAQMTEDTSAYIKYMEKILIRSMKTVIDILDTSKAEVSQKDLLTIAKFAKYVGLPVSTIRYWVQQNKFKPYSYTASGYMLFSKQQREDIKQIIRHL